MSFYIDPAFFIIVAVAISMPAIREKIAFEKRRSAARQARKERV